MKLHSSSIVSKSNEYYKRPTLKPFVIPVFIPHMGCPHRCVFCDQTAISGVEVHIPNSLQITKIINSFLQYYNTKRSFIQVAFYGGNFLGLPKSIICNILEAVTPFLRNRRVNSIRFSTRPDTVNLNTLSVIEPYSVKTIELGAQSMDDYVLKLSQRGHTVRDTRYAVDMLKSAGYDVGVQIMLGLPGDNENKAIKSAERIAALSPDFVRIYPTIVIRNSLLSTMYRNGSYTPLQLVNCVSLTKRIFMIFRKRAIPVIRMGLQASKDLNERTEVIAGPYHPAFGHMVYSEIFLDAIRSSILQMSHKPESIIIRVHPKNISRVQGLGFSNIKSITTEFHLDSVVIDQCKDMNEESLNICGNSIKVY